jgi:nitroimidazol reductase NimA-like FMN-containing flavoprotein (pyridoxamine 5'-phosphate oxidase superfamily)
VDVSSEEADRELVELTLEECLGLLGMERIARLATSRDGAPDVVPVNFVLREGAPVFRTHEGTILRRALGNEVALQVDRFDWFHRTGWSVLVRGRAELVVVAEVGEAPEPWVPGDKPWLVRIEPTLVTGRRINLHQQPLDSWGYL